MRRKLSYWVLALLVPLGFVSCSQEEIAPQDEQELRIATRSTSDENAAESFTDDFTLELWSTTDNAKYERMGFYRITDADTRYIRIANADEQKFQ